MGTQHSQLKPDHPNMRNHMYVNRPLILMFGKIIINIVSGYTFKGISFRN